MNLADATSQLKEMGKGKIPEAILNLIVLAVLGVLQRLYADENFKCPCYISTSEEDMANNCRQSTLYSILFMVLTTLAAWCLGFLIISTMKCVLSERKVIKQAISITPKGNVEILSGENGKEYQTTPMTDIRQRQSESEKQIAVKNPGEPQIQPASEDEVYTADPDACLYFFYGFKTSHCCGQFAESIVIALAWCCLLLIDGDYVACAANCNPYGNKNCTDIRGLPHDQLPFTKEFSSTRRISQYVGILVTIITVAIYGVAKNCSFRILCCCTCKSGDNKASGCDLLPCMTCRYSKKLDDTTDKVKLEDILKDFRKPLLKQGEEVAKGIWHEIKESGQVQSGQAGSKEASEDNMITLAECN